MKIKSLLFAALAAGMSLSASAADHENCGDLLTATNVQVKPGEIAVVELLLTKQTAPDFTTIQFDIIFPEGLKPCLNEDNVYAWAGDDIVMAGKPKAPVVSYTDNFANPDKYPQFTVVGANSTNNKQTSNPCQLYYFNVTADSSTPSGEYELKAANLKYTTYSGDTYATAAEQVICKVTVDNPNPTAISVPNANATVKTRKVVENGQVFIIAGEAKYNVMSQKVK